MEQMMSAAEWQVMRVIWAHPGCTSSHIIAALQEGFDWQATTIKTLLSRLWKKGYLEMEKVAIAYRYHPLISEETHLNHQIQLLLDNMCSTKHDYLVHEMLRVGEFSQKDLITIANHAQEQVKQAPEMVACHCLKGQCTCGSYHRKKEK